MIICGICFTTNLMIRRLRDLMVGKIGIFLSPYYDMARKVNSFKRRPALIVGIADAGDYNVLPISKITQRQHFDFDYDIPIDITIYPNLNLTQNPSYIRVHKQTVFNSRALDKTISNPKIDYPDLYLSIITKLEEYNKKLIEKAL